MVMQLTWITCHKKTMRYYLGTIYINDADLSYKQMCVIKSRFNRVPVTYEHNTIPHAAVYTSKNNIPTTQENVWRVNEKLCEGSGRAVLGECNHIWYTAQNDAWYCLFGLHPDGKWPYVQKTIERNVINGLSLTYHRDNLLPYEITICKTPFKQGCHIIYSTTEIEVMLEYIRIHCPDTIGR